MIKNIEHLSFKIVLTPFAKEGGSKPLCFETGDLFCLKVFK